MFLLLWRCFMPALSNDMGSIIITCNAGSTNSKLAVFDASSLECEQNVTLYSDTDILAWLKNIKDKNTVAAIGHRVVHGGDKFVNPTIISRDVIHELERFVPLAPLHQPAALKLIAEVGALYPDTLQIACFDTAFHHTMPEQEHRLPLPDSYFETGIKRYGFHGLSYEYIAFVLPEYAGDKANGRVIVAHLGGGSSACAMKNLTSVASTMGFSTLDGLMMSTRCGALDAGVILHLLEEKNMSVGEVTKLLYKNSGLLGVSGISADMRELLSSDKKEAKTAIDLYCYLASKQIASLLPATGGMDALVFTGGVGEHAEGIRQKIISHLSWLGDFSVYVIPANEEAVLARACRNNIKN